MHGAALARARARDERCSTEGKAEILRHKGASRADGVMIPALRRARGGAGGRGDGAERVGGAVTRGEPVFPGLGGRVVEAAGLLTLGCVQICIVNASQVGYASS